MSYSCISIYIKLNIIVLALCFFCKLFFLEFIIIQKAGSQNVRTTSSVDRSKTYRQTTSAWSNVHVYLTGLQCGNSSVARVWYSAKS